MPVRIHVYACIHLHMCTRVSTPILVSLFKLCGLTLGTVKSSWWERHVHRMQPGILGCASAQQSQDLLLTHLRGQEQEPLWVIETWNLLCLLQIKARIISTVEESDWIQLKACSARHYHAKQYTSKGAVSSLLNRAQQQGHNQPSHHQLWQKMGQADGP